MPEFPYLILSFIILSFAFPFLRCDFFFISISIFFIFRAFIKLLSVVNGNPGIISAGVMHLVVFHTQSHCIWPGFYELRAWYINSRHADQGVRQPRTKCGKMI